MRIRHISIERLFGTFDHQIPLFQREPVTIIHGPNGVGKTSILRVVYGTLRAVHSHIRSIPFQRLSLDFEDGSSLWVVQRPPTEAEVAVLRRPARLVPRVLDFRLMRNGTVDHEHSVLPTRHPQHRSPARLFDQWLPFLTRVGTDAWHDGTTNLRLTYDEVLRLRTGPA